MPRSASFVQALNHSVAQLVGLVSVLTQFFGAFNALKLEWIGVVADLRVWAAGLSTIFSIGGFLLGWHDGRIVREEERRRDARSPIVRAFLGMIGSFVLFWLMNVGYSTDSPNKLVDVSARFGFLLTYSALFGFLSYLAGLVSAVWGGEDKKDAT